MADKKKVFTVKVDGADVEFAVVKPSHKVLQKANQIYNRAFREAIDSGAIVRARIEAVMREQKLWDDDKQRRYEEVTKRLLEAEMKLTKGGIKLSDAHQVAVQMRMDRVERMLLDTDRNALIQNTAEAQAENARFNFLLSASTVYSDTGKLYYKDFEDYQARDEDPVSSPAYVAFQKLMYGLEDNFEAKTPENQFLLKYGFCNEKLSLIDKKSGRLVDTKGRFIDDQGRLVNEQGELVDDKGNLLTEDGAYKVEFTDFIDDVTAA